MTSRFSKAMVHTIMLKMTRIRTKSQNFSVIKAFPLKMKRKAWTHLLKMMEELRNIQSK